MPKGFKGFQKGHPLFMNPEKLRGRHTSPATEFKIGHSLNKGIKKSMLARIHMSIAKKKNPTRYWLGKKRPDISENQRGEKGNNWQGGKTPINKILRRSAEFKNWREVVFARDNWTCQFCGVRGGKIHPHHIRPFALFPLLRFDVLNGITLCESCHKTTPRFGNGSKAIYKESAYKNGSYRTYLT